MYLGIQILNLVQLYDAARVLPFTEWCIDMCPMWILVWIGTCVSYDIDGDGWRTGITTCKFSKADIISAVQATTTRATTSAEEPGVSHAMK